MTHLLSEVRTRFHATPQMLRKLLDGEKFTVTPIPRETGSG